MKLFGISAVSAVIIMLAAACGNGKSDNGLADAAAVADSIARADAGGAVVEQAPDLEASFTIADQEISVGVIEQELFDVFASQQLKRLNNRDIAKVCDALRKSGGSFITVLNSPSGDSVSFTLTPHQIIGLQRAKNSELNIGAAKAQAVAVAERMVPNPEAHAGAARVDVAVVKSFLEYNIVWPKASAYSRMSQGVLTQNYFNALKKQYQDLGGLAEPVISMLETMGVDGVRIVYSAEDSDRELKQAFPWREIRLPIEENKN